MDKIFLPAYTGIGGCAMAIVYALMWRAKKMYDGYRYLIMSIGSGVAICCAIDLFLHPRPVGFDEIFMFLTWVLMVWEMLRLWEIAKALEPVNGEYSVPNKELKRLRQQLRTMIILMTFVLFLIVGYSVVLIIEGLVT